MFSIDDSWNSPVVHSHSLSFLNVLEVVMNTDVLDVHFVDDLAVAFSDPFDANALVHESSAIPWKSMAVAEIAMVSVKLPFDGRFPGVVRGRSFLLCRGMLHPDAEPSLTAVLLMVDFLHETGLFISNAKGRDTGHHVTVFRADVLNNLHAAVDALCLHFTGLPAVASK
jgi:hypothetical protein